MASNKTTFIIEAVAKGLNKLKGLEKGMKGIDAQTNKTAKSLSKLKGVANSAIGALGALGATAAVAGFAKAGIDMQRTQKTLKILTEEYGEHKEVLKFVDEAANRFGLGQQRAAKGVSDLFGRLRPMGISLDGIKDVYLGINNAALRYNLSAADTEGVMLQLSQALGSGKLQGDEFRSVMERLPAVGQAIAESMGVSINELKKLSSDGELTTDKIVAAMQKLASADAPPPDAYKLYRKEMENLATAIGTQLLPIFTPLVKTATFAIGVFNAMPGPIKFVASAILGIGAAVLIVGPPLAIMASAFAALEGTKLGLTLVGVAGKLSALLPILGSLKVAMLAALGPVAVPALITAGVVAGLAVIWKFRDNIWQAFVWLGTKIKDMWTSLGRFFAGPFVEGAKAVKNVWNGLINWIKGVLDRVFGWINRLVKQIKKVTSLGRGGGGSRGRATATRAMAAGGVLDGPELVLAGEAGREYIIPEGKMSAASKNWLSGKRGGAVIPAFAQGGVVGSSGSTGGAPNIHIQTGPVLQQQGQQFVTLSDLEGALQTFSKSVFGNSRTTGGRRFQGVH